MKKISNEVLIIVAALFLLTLAFNLFDLDNSIMHNFWNAEDGWHNAEIFPWQQLRDYSPIIAILISFAALIFIIIGLNVKKYEKYRKICAFFVLLMIIAPGLIVNSLLKEHFGRPRPRDTIEFDGEHLYEAPLAYNSASPGKSFPSGHATMGYYFFGFYILFRRRHKKFAVGALIFTILFGSLIGLTRMVQGAHYPSDIIWSAAICYFTSLWLYHIFRFDKTLYYIPQKDIPSAKKKLFTAIASSLILLLIAAALVATPVNKRHTVRFDKSLLKQANIIELDFVLEQTEVDIVQSDSLFIRWQYKGFGAPKSRLRSNELETFTDSTYLLKIEQYKTGFFTEFQQKLTIHIPRNKKTHLRYKIGDETNISNYEF